LVDLPLKVNDDRIYLLAIPEKTVMTSVLNYNFISAAVLFAPYLRPNVRATMHGKITQAESRGDSHN
jgi:hypothetical protein